MKNFFLAFAVIFLLFSCKKESVYTQNTDWQRVSGRVKMKESHDALELTSGNQTYKFTKSRLPFKKIVFLNASLIGYVAELGQEDKIVGVSSPEYIFSEKIHGLINENKIANIGNEQKYDVEKILSLKPDAVFTNNISSFGNTYDLLRKNGIEVIFLDEYLEENPLEKSAYLKVFGKLLGAETLAEKKLAQITTNYKDITRMAASAKEKPVVLSNEMYGSQWFLPGGRTAAAKFISDAGGKYILAQNADAKAVPLSFEEVFAKSENAKIWVNLGNHKGKDELLAINPNYAKMKVYQNGKLYAMTGRERNKSNDFFESGVVRSDQILKDFVKIFHPELLPNYKLTYMRPLK